MEIKISNQKSISEALEEVKKVSENELVLIIEKGSPIFLNKLNLKIFTKGLDKLDLTYTIKTDDPKGNVLLGVTKDSTQLKRQEEQNEEEEEKSEEEIKLAQIKQKKDTKILFIALSVFGVFFLVAFLAVFAWWVVPSSNITLKVKSDILVRNIDITADTDAKEKDIENQLIPALILSAEKTEKRTVTTSGKKTVGEKAKGEVDLINKTTNDKTFDAGTILTLESNTSLVFILDEETKVPKAEESGTTLNYGTKGAKVTAEKIGSKYNIPKDETFTIGDEEKSSFFAKANSDFESGTSKEVASISEGDILKLKNEMEGFIEGEALKTLQDKLVGDQQLLEGAYKVIMLKEEFDKKLDDIADSLSYEQTAKITGIIFSKQDLDRAVKIGIKRLIPEDLSSPDVEEKTEITNAIAENIEEYAPNKAKLKLLVKVKTFVTPKIDIEATKKAVSGIKLNDANTYLSKLPRVSQININLEPALPGFLQTMPHKTDKIKIEIVNE